MSAANQGAISNLGVVVGTDAVAVIDSGGSPIEAHAFTAAVGKITAKPVRYLINTHAHPDHVFGNAAFREIGATIVGHHNLPRAPEARGAFCLQSFREQIGGALMKGIETVSPTMLVKDRLHLDLGERTLEAGMEGGSHRQ
ncbi:MBL fold metallo-hydrolase [Mesorhizobium sp. M0166]|uniref:MBL fold metallo-hydrolase n=1 Tax=unclassified Mesorhizobium TaxID=325217 RepID=UPI00333C3BF7